MSFSPKNNMEKLERILNAWTTLAPNVEFGMSRQQFEAYVNASRSFRTEMETLENQLTKAAALRDQSDEEALVKAEQVKNGILAHPDEGPNSPLYEAIGYIRKADKKSGLTRKKSSPDKQS